MLSQEMCEQQPRLDRRFAEPAIDGDGDRDHKSTSLKGANSLLQNGDQMMRMWHRQPDWELEGRGGDGKSDFVALGAARGRDRRYYSQMQRGVNAPRLVCATSIVVSLLVVCRLAAQS